MILLIVITAVLGFTLAFVCNGVLKTADTSVKECMLVVFLWGVGNVIAGMGLESVEIPPLVHAAISLIVSFLVLSALLVLIIKATIRQAAIIAAIYAAILFLLLLGLASCSAK